MSVEKKTDVAPPKGGPSGRRPYTAPRLTEYGSVAKLTQGTLTVQNDGSSGNSWKKACL